MTIDDENLNYYRTAKHQILEDLSNYEETGDGLRPGMSLYSHLNHCLTSDVFAEVYAHLRTLIREPDLLRWTLRAQDEEVEKLLGQLDTWFANNVVDEAIPVPAPEPKKRTHAPYISKPQRIKATVPERTAPKRRR